MHASRLHDLSPRNCHCRWIVAKPRSKSVQRPSTKYQYSSSCPSREKPGLRLCPGLAEPQEPQGLNATGVLDPRKDLSGKRLTPARSLPLANRVSEAAISDFLQMYPSDLTRYQQGKLGKGIWGLPELSLQLFLNYPKMSTFKEPASKCLVQRSVSITPPARGDFPTLLLSSCCW